MCSGIRREFDVGLVIPSFFLCFSKSYPVKSCILPIFPVKVPVFSQRPGRTPGVCSKMALAEIIRAMFSRRFANNNFYLFNSHIWQSLSLRDWRWKAAVTLRWMGATFRGSCPPRSAASATPCAQR